MDNTAAGIVSPRPFAALAPLGGCQRLFGALTDQVSFQFCNRGYLCEEEFPHGARRNAREVAEHQINVASHNFESTLRAGRPILNQFSAAGREKSFLDSIGQLLPVEGVPTIAQCRLRSERRLKVSALANDALGHKRSITVSRSK